MNNNLDGSTQNGAAQSGVNAALPRKVRLYSDDARRLFWCVAIFFAVGAVWLGGFFPRTAKEARQWVILQRGGSETTGEITGRTKSIHSIFVQYEFSTSNGAFQNTVELPSGRHIDASVGDKIQIRFLPSQPSVNYPDGWGFPLWRDLIPNLFMLLFPVLATIGAVFLFRERHLARSGLVAEGNVTGCEPNGRKFRVYYDFLAEDGRTFEGVNDYSSDEYENGSRIPVIYLRNRPERNDCYPMTSYRTIQ